MSTANCIITGMMRAISRFANKVCLPARRAHSGTGCCKNFAQTVCMEYCAALHFYTGRIYQGGMYGVSSMWNKQGMGLC